MWREGTCVVHEDWELVHSSKTHLQGSEWQRLSHMETYMKQ